MKTIRKWLAARRLAKTLKPRPEIRARRLAQMDIERKRRCIRMDGDSFSQPYHPTWELEVLP